MRAVTARVQGDELTPGDGVVDVFAYPAGSERIVRAFDDERRHGDPREVRAVVGQKRCAREGSGARRVGSAETRGQLLAQLGSLVHVDNAAFRAIRAATPGPYTFILTAMPEVPKRLLHPKKKTVGVRIPEHPFVRALLEELGEPLLSSSLIMPEETEPRTVGWEIKEDLDHDLDVVVEAGETTAEPTTVVDFSTGVPEVLRRGAGDPDRFE